MHPTKGEGRTKKKDPSLNQKHTNPKGDQSGQRSKLCSTAPTSRKKHIRKKAKDTCDDDMFQDCIILKVIDILYL